MALRTSKVSAYCSNIRQLTSRLRVLSVQPAVERHVLEPRTNVAQNAILGGNKQYPFPGGVTSQIAYKNAQPEIIASVQPLPAAEVQIKPSSELKANEITDRSVEVKVINCPDEMKKKASELFPGHDVDKMSVLNVTQKTENDMSYWSANMEVEWLAVTNAFIESAVAACNALKSFGYWADFVDPTTGKAYLNKTESEVTLQTTDDEYRSLGFDITDMGCCKIIAHKLWGKMVFVGTIFTNAPIDSPAVSEILAKVNAA